MVIGVQVVWYNNEAYRTYTRGLKHFNFVFINVCRYIMLAVAKQTTCKCKIFQVPALKITKETRKVDKYFLLLEFIFFLLKTEQ